jgi:carbon storage regulator
MRNRGGAVLLIRRRAGQSILIGADIEIQIIELGPNRVKLGITAPPHIPVMRKEAQLTREQNQVAADSLNTGAIAKFIQDFIP